MTLVALLPIVLLPLLWSRACRLVRHFSDGDRVSSDYVEKSWLVLMVVPILVGAAVVMMGTNALTPSALPIGEDSFDDAYLFAQAETSSDRVIMMLPPVAELAARGLWLVLGGIALVRLVKFFAARLWLRGVLQRADRWVIGGSDVVVSREVETPILAPNGVPLLPRSVLKTLSAEQCDLIIAHEYAHRDRGDALWFMVLALIDSVFWYDASLRRQVSFCRLAAEVDCDARVLAASPGQRKAYAETLVLLLKQSTKPTPLGVPAILRSRHKGESTMRLSAIMTSNTNSKRFRSRRSLIITAAALIPAFFAQSSLANGVALEPDFSTRVVEGRRSSEFGPRVHPITGAPKQHYGTDIAAATGTPVYAPAPGLVAKLEVREGYGKMITIDHGEGYMTRYAQLDGFDVEQGAQVVAGQQIGRVGSTGASTGPHLHVEVFVDGERVDPATVLNLPPRQN